MSETDSNEPEEPKSTWEKLKGIAETAESIFSQVNKYYGIGKSVLGAMGIDLFKENDVLRDLVIAQYNDLKKDLKELEDYLEAHDKSGKMESIATKMSDIRAVLETVRYVKPGYVNFMILMKL